MNCPSCGAAMTPITLDGNLGTRVELDFCAACQVIWFDHFENLRLSPAGTLQLFRVIGDRSRMSPLPLKNEMHCPRCGLRLLFTQDRQRNTPFRYWRCAREHGRIETFFDFLREKDFIRPLSPQQLAELRQNVQTINCSNCGAPIDLVHEGACAHCGTAISMLDVRQIAQQFASPEPSQAPPDDKQHIRALFEALQAHESWDRSSSVGLVEAGLWTLSRLLG